MSQVTHFMLQNSRNGDEVEYDLFGYLAQSQKEPPPKANALAQLKAARVCLIYGRNGAGKTTFARDLSEAIQSRKCTSKSENGEWVKGLCDAGGQPVLPSLFNEDFANSIGYKEEETSSGHLSTIVLLGEQQENQNQIDTLLAEESELRQTLQETRTSLELLESRREGGIAHQKDLVKGLLKRPGSWASYRQRAIFSDRAPRVDDGTVRALLDEIERTDLPSTDHLTAERARVLNLLEQSSGKAEVNSSIPAFELPWDLQNVEALFMRVPEVRAQDSLAVHFKSVLGEELGSYVLRFALNAFSQPENSTCPACAQNVRNERKSELTSALKQVLEANERVQLSERIKGLPSLADSYPPNLEVAQAEVLSNTALAEFRDARSTIMSVLDNLSTLAKEKYSNPESAIQIPKGEYVAAALAYEEARERCASELEAFNETVTAAKSNLEAFHRLNIQVVSRDADINEAALTLKRLEEDRQVHERRIGELEGRLAEVKRDLQLLRSRELNQEDALEMMNGFLAVVFADSNRLKLKPAENAYRVQSRGHDVALSDLSTGERNIIALVYFFANIFREGDDHRKFEQQRFLILDDPVSSFDSDNKFGVFLLIKQIVQRFLKHSSTQIVITSHDLSLIQDLATVMKTVGNASCVVRRIENHQILPLQLGQYANYSTLLKKIYDYASIAKPETAAPESIPTGNEMRLVLEAFAQFEVSQSITDLPEAKVVNALVQGESVALGRYFVGPIYRLLLHGESHSADSIRAGDFELSPIASGGDRQQIAREMIVLITIISPVHIPAKLGMKTPGNDPGNAYHQVGFEENCHQWKAAMEERALSPVE